MRDAAPAAEGEASRPPIPLSILVQLYRFMRAMSQEERLQLGRWLVEHPAALRRWARGSFACYLRYANPRERFCPEHEPLRRPEDVAELRNGRDVAAVLADRPDRRWWEVDGLGGRFRFVDYEVPPLRTTGRATFEDGSSSTRGMKADVVLAGEDGTPVVGEVKAATGKHYDTDPVLALIQALTLATQLATPAQRERLRLSYPDEPFSADGPVGVFVLLLKPARPANATFQAKLAATAADLARAVMPLPNVPIGPLALVEARWDGELRLALTAGGS